MHQCLYGMGFVENFDHNHLTNLFANLPICGSIYDVTIRRKAGKFCLVALGHWVPICWIYFNGFLQKGKLHGLLNEDYGRESRQYD